MPFHIQAWIEMGRQLGRELTAEEIQRDFSGRKNEELFPMVARRALPPDEITQLAEQKEARYRELYAPHMRFIGSAAYVPTAQCAHSGVSGVCRQLGGQYAVRPNTNGATVPSSAPHSSACPETLISE